MRKPIVLGIIACSLFAIGFVSPTALPTNNYCISDISENTDGNPATKTNCGGEYVVADEDNN